MASARLPRGTNVVSVDAIDDESALWGVSGANGRGRNRLSSQRNERLVDSAHGLGIGRLTRRPPKSSGGANRLKRRYTSPESSAPGSARHALLPQFKRDTELVARLAMRGRQGAPAPGGRSAPSQPFPSPACRARRLSREARPGVKAGPVGTVVRRQRGGQTPGAPARVEPSFMRARGFARATQAQPGSALWYARRGYPGSPGGRGRCPPLSGSG
jgi:hypothetical protein